jgi:hypothetical protein
VWSALIEVAQNQSQHQREANPVDRFLGLLRSAISAGHAHLATRAGGSHCLIETLYAPFNANGGPPRCGCLARSWQMKEKGPLHKPEDRL